MALSVGYRSLHSNHYFFMNLIVLISIQTLVLTDLTDFFFCIVKNFCHLLYSFSALWDPRIDEPCRRQTE